MSTNVSTVHCIMVLDQSGSMSDVRDETYKSIQQFIKDRQEDKAETFFSLVKFSFSSSIEQSYDRVDVKKIDTDFRYNPDGSTALYQAIGQTIEKYANETSKVVFVIVTDGHDNASVKPYSKTFVNEKISEQQKKGWEFIFLGANQEQFDESVNIGVHNVAYFQMNASSISGALQCASRGISGYVSSGRMPTISSPPSQALPPTPSVSYTPFVPVPLVKFASVTSQQPCVLNLPPVENVASPSTPYTTPERCFSTTEVWNRIKN